MVFKGEESDGRMLQMIIHPVFRFNDPWFRQKITDDYVKERSEYRRTGKNTNQRTWEEYVMWKMKNGGWEDDKASVEV